MIGKQTKQSLRYCVAGIAVLVNLSVPAIAGDPVTIPPVENLERLDSWRAGVAAADAADKTLEIVCIGDSNTEGPAYVGELRRLLQGCYGERGIGYHSLGNRAEVPGAPRIERQGNWTFLRDAPPAHAPPPPYFALDGIWAETDDPAADVRIEFVFGSWQKPDYHLARAYNLQHRVRIHYRVGPELGAFSVYTGPGQPRRIDCRAETPGYAVSEPFLCDEFRIADIDGKVTLFGFDARRTYYLQGQPVLPGGVLVHALGKGWGMAAEPAAVEDDAYAAFFDAINPDLITIMLGTNDMHNDGRVHVHRQNLTRTIRKLQTHSPGTGILVIACPEAGQTGAGVAARFRDAARAVADETGCAFWSLQDLVGPRSANWYRQGFYNDGLHYSAVGGSVIARMLLRQLGFDLNDPRHYPALRQPREADGRRPRMSVNRLGPQTLETLVDALAGEAPQHIWVNRDKVVELRLAVAGDALAVHARVADHQCDGPPETWRGGGFDLYVANPKNIARVMHNQDGPVVRQVVFRAVKPEDEPRVMVKQFTMDAQNRVIPWETEGDFPYRITPRDPVGYEVAALIPFEDLVLTEDTEEFLLECAVIAAAVPGGAPTFSRMFATRGDAGAFRDATLSARVTIAP